LQRKARIQQFAGNVSEIDLAGILVLKLFQAAARAAVAQALPFCVGHLFQRLGFPKETLWPEGGLDWEVMSPEVFRTAAVGVGPSRGYGPTGASGMVRQYGKAGTTLSLPIEIASPTIGLWPLLGLDMGGVPEAQMRLGFAATFPQEVSTVPGGVREALAVPFGLPKFVQGY